MDFALWEIAADEYGNSSAGRVVFFAVTDDEETLPDPHAAHAAVRKNRDMSLHSISSVRLVEAIGPVTNGALIDDRVHDQRKPRAVASRSLGL